MDVCENLLKKKLVERKNTGRTKYMNDFYHLSNLLPIQKHGTHHINKYQSLCYTDFKYIANN